MSEPVSSPSLLTITAPTAKPSSSASEDFSKQLSSLAKADENRPPASKKEKVKAEEPPIAQSSDKKELRPEPEQEPNSSEKIAPSTTQEKTVDDVAEELVVAAPIIVTSASEKSIAPEELLPLETTVEIAVVTGDSPEESTDQTLDHEAEHPSVKGKTAEQLPVKATTEAIGPETNAPETIAASTEIVTKKSNEQELATPLAVVSEEESETAAVTSAPTTNDQNDGEKQEEKTPNDPSLLSKLNKVAIQGDGQEAGEVELPVEKPNVSSSSLPVAATAVTATEKALPTDEKNLDTNDATGRLATVSGAEERANQRAELAATAKTRTNSAPTIDPSRFVSRVTKAFEAAQLQGGGPIRIRLSPPELGMLQVQIEVKEGVLTASLEAETHAARNLLLENLPALRERLAEQQISIEKFDVDVRDESSGTEYDQANSQESDADAQGDRQDQRRTTSTDADNVLQTNTTSTTPSSTISFDNDRVDLVA